MGLFNGMIFLFVEDVADDVDVVSIAAVSNSANTTKKKSVQSFRKRRRCDVSLHSCI